MSLTMEEPPSHRYVPLSSSSSSAMTRLGPDRSLLGVLHGLLSRLLRALFFLVLLLAAFFAVIFVHSLYPVSDPMTPLGRLDTLSLWLGVHEQTAVVVMELALFSSTVYTYVFHRHVADGTFHVSSETKTHILPGLFNADNATLLDERLHELMDTARRQVPESCWSSSNAITKSRGKAQRQRPPVVAKFAQDALRTADKQELSSLVSALNSAFLNSSNLLSYNRRTSLGTLNPSEQRALQWFAINLLSHTLVQKDFSVQRTPVILDLGKRDLELTLAVSSRQALPDKRVVQTSKLTAFGHLVKLVTIRVEHLGLLESRHDILMRPSVDADGDGDADQARKDASKQRRDRVHSACFNPITEAHWVWSGQKLHITGKEEPDFELVKEKSGPFVGKKIQRPVANYNECHESAVQHIKSHLDHNDTVLLQSLFKGRPVFMEGLLLEKCLERGLTLPYRGGDVRFKAFHDSMQHACKVPNTEQPFGCVDLVYLAGLLERLFGFKSGAVLRAASNIGGMTGDWPLAAAFHVYENGL